MNIFVIDGNSVAFRGWAKMPQLKAYDKYNTEVIYHFFVILRKYINQLKPDIVVVAWDSYKSFRKESNSDYKSNRTKSDKEKELLKSYYRQVEELKKWLPKLSINSIEEYGYEADDIIAVVSRRFAKSGHSVYILSGDRDLLQLVNKNIKFINLKTGKIENSFILQKNIRLAPKYVVWYKSICGDTSDNIKGVEGLGIKWFIKNCVNKKMNSKGVFPDGTLIYDLIEKEKGVKAVGELQESYEMVRLPYGLNYGIVNINKLKKFNYDNKKGLVEFLHNFNIKSISVNNVWKQD